MGAKKKGVKRAVSKSRTVKVKPGKKTPMAATGPQCSMDSFEDLNPQNICTCARGLVELLAEMRSTMQDPQKVVKSLMVDSYYRYGPKKIKGSPGWWFRAYRPELKITSNDKLKLTVKAGVKKTRGAVQFGWRTADHTFTIPLPAQYEQYRLVLDRIEAMEGQLNSLVNNVCEPLGY